MLTKKRTGSHLDVLSEQDKRAPTDEHDAKLLATAGAARSAEAGRATELLEKLNNGRESIPYLSVEAVLLQSDVFCLPHIATKCMFDIESYDAMRSINVLGVEFSNFMSNPFVRITASLHAHHVLVNFPASFIGDGGQRSDGTIVVKLHFQLGGYPVTPWMVEVVSPYLLGYVGHAAMDFPHLRPGSWKRANSTKQCTLTDVVMTLSGLFNSCDLKVDLSRLAYHPLEVKLSHLGSLFSANGHWMRRDDLAKGLCKWLETNSSGFVTYVEKRDTIVRGDRVGAYASSSSIDMASSSAGAFAAVQKKIATKLADICDMRCAYIYWFTDILLKEKDMKSIALVLADSCLGTFIQLGLIEVESIDKLIHSNYKEGAPEIQNTKKLIWWSAALTKAVVDHTDLRSVAAPSIVTPAVLDMCLDASDLGEGWDMLYDCGHSCKTHGFIQVVEPVASESVEDRLYRETMEAHFVTDVNIFEHTYGPNGTFYILKDVKQKCGMDILGDFGPIPTKALLKERKPSARNDLRHGNCAIYEIWNAGDMRLASFPVVAPMDPIIPYQGIFVFDFIFPNSYPNEPPNVSMFYTSGGRHGFNPNIYPKGEICLSLLGTWGGHESEKWNASTSNIRQVLLSMQTFFFTADAFHNEPGREHLTAENIKESRVYNQTTRECSILYAIIGPILAALQDKKADALLKGKMKMGLKEGWNIKHRPELERIVVGHFALKADGYLKIVDSWINDKDNNDVVGDGAFKISIQGGGHEPSNCNSEIRANPGKTHTERLKEYKKILETLFPIVAAKQVSYK